MSLFNPHQSLTVNIQVVNTQWYIVETFNSAGVCDYKMYNKDGMKLL